MMRLKVTFEKSSLLNALRSHQKQGIPECRKRLVERLMRVAVQKIIMKNPVDTGRSRSSWVAALKQLGGVPIAGWEGETPDNSAISEGAASSSVTPTETKTATEIRVTSGVNYILFLEYGTSKMAPFQMVRQGILAARSAVR